MSDSVANILRDYYAEKDFISSPDGILKILSVIACIVEGVVALAAGGGRAGCGGGGGGVSLASAALLALLTALALLATPERAPLLWLYTDVVTSSLIGLVLVVTVTLGAIFCQLDSAVDYIYLCLGLVTVGLVGSSAVLGYWHAMRRVDRVRPRTERRVQAPPPGGPEPQDVDV